MPVTTRRQAKNNDNKLDPSELVEQDMLHNVSQHSPNYGKVLYDSTIAVVSSLYERKRVAESRGLRALYDQSFRDPGSKELLEAILRGRMNEQQMIDFRRYTQDVNSVRELQVGKVSEGLLDLPEGHRASRHPPGLWRPEVQVDSGESAVSKTERLKFLGSQPRSLDEMRMEEEVDAEAGRKRDRGVEVTEFLELLQAQMDASAVEKRPRKRRRRNRMFTGANGPVYLADTLGLG